MYRSAWGGLVAVGVGVAVGVDVCVGVGVEEGVFVGVDVGVTVYPLATYGRKSIAEGVRISPTTVSPCEVLPRLNDTRQIAARTNRNAMAITAVLEQAIVFTSPALLPCFSRTAAAIAVAIHGLVGCVVEHGLVAIVVPDVGAAP
jgi:hypothetical protein